MGNDEIRIENLCSLGLLSKDNDQGRSEDDLYSLISSTTDRNISINTSERCTDLTRPLLQSHLDDFSSSSESDISKKTLFRSSSVETDLGEDQPFSRHLNEDQESTSQDLLRSTSIKENRTGSRKKAVSPNQSSCFSLGDKIQQQQINQQNIAKHEIQLNCKQLGDMESRV